MYGVNRTPRMDVETEPIHFTQDDHHSIQERPTHDAPIGSRTPAATGEDDAKKEWKVLVTFSVTPVPMEHSSDLRAENKVSLWPDCTLSPLSPKVESEPVGDPVVSDPMYPRGIHLSLRQDPNTVREEPTVLSTASLATQR